MDCTVQKMRLCAHHKDIMEGLASNVAIKDSKEHLVGLLHKMPKISQCIAVRYPKQDMLRSARMCLTSSLTL